MAEINSNTKLILEVKLTLSEEEAKALNAITVYGSDKFLEMFYEHLGKTYLEEYEDGLISLFDSVKDKLSVILKQNDNLRSNSKLK